MIGRIHNQMGYNATGSSLAELITTKELLCAAQCANHFPTCNIAVFNGSAIYQCSLFSELLMPQKLMISSTAVVYDFQLSKFPGTKYTGDQHRSLYTSLIPIKLDFFCSLDFTAITSSTKQCIPVVELLVRF